MDDVFFFLYSFQETIEEEEIKKEKDLGKEEAEVVREKLAVYTNGLG